MTLLETGTGRSMVHLYNRRPVDIADSPYTDQQPWGTTLHKSLKEKVCHSY